MEGWCRAAGRGPHPGDPPDPGDPGDPGMSSQPPILFEAVLKKSCVRPPRGRSPSRPSPAAPGRPMGEIWDVWGVQVLHNLIIFGLNWVEVAQNGLILWENEARHSKKLSKYPPAPQDTLKTSKNKCSTKIHKIVPKLYISL